MTHSEEFSVAERFLKQVDDDSFEALFRVFSPQLLAFFRRRGHERGVAEDLAQEVMLTVYRKATQLRDHRLFRAWLFRVARNTACRYFEQRRRQVQTVELGELGDIFASPACSERTAGSEFRDWLKFLDDREQQTVVLRFVEEWEYHEIAAAQAVPVGTVQWRVFNSKKKLAAHLRPLYVPDRAAA